MVRKEQNTSSQQKKNWAEILFVEHPHLFLPELEKLLAQSEDEVSGLCRIFEEFKIEKGSKILDLSCGIGRHTLPLAKRGYKVVGYDPSSYFLEKAKQNSESHMDDVKGDIRYYEGKICIVDKILFENGEYDFSAIFTMFNSIGYTTVEDDLKLFKKLLSLSKCGGILITETENRDWRIRNFLPFVNYEYNNSVVCESWQFDLENSLAKSLTTYYGKRASSKNLFHLLDLPTQMRLYSLHELKDLVNRSGWTYQKSYSGIQNNEPVTLGSSDIVTVSKKC